MTLTCSRCKREKDRSEFYRDSRTATGRQSVCRDCRQSEARKECAACGAVKTRGCFARHTGFADGLRHVCRLCERAARGGERARNEVRLAQFNLSRSFAVHGTTMEEEMAVGKAAWCYVKRDGIPDRHVEALFTEDTSDGRQRAHKLSAIVIQAGESIKRGYMRLSDLPYTEETREEAA